jgi:predicted thioredoxin/glutaredoxin
MTLLLVMEAIDGGKIALSDMVTASEYAASMGGSQVYLKVGETMSVEDMLKSVVISSANDAAVALAEFVSGDVDSFASANVSTKIELSTGKIRLQDSKTGELTLKSSTGDMTLKNIEAENVSIKVSTGDVTMDTVFCKSLRFN